MNPLPPFPIRRYIPLSGVFLLVWSRFQRRFWTAAGQFRFGTMEHSPCQARCWRAASPPSDAPQVENSVADPNIADVQRYEEGRRESGEPRHTEEQRFVLQVVQPGLAGLMDGSVSTLAPLFATAFATQSPHTAFLVGLAAAVGAGISMGFSEGLSDDGKLTGRGNPLMRGIITGGMTFVGGVGHTLPFLLSSLHLALIFAYVVVGVELVAIAVIRNKYFNMNFWMSMVQVVVGGVLVFAAGVLIGGSG
jgi:hypothetical protein